MARAPLLVAAGLGAQAVLLVPLAGAGPPAAASLAIGGALAAWLAVVAWARLAPGARAALAMLAAGGLGMTLGWWADLGFASAADALRAAPEAAAWCGLAPRAAGPGGLSWMDAGMLAAGLAAMGAAHAHRGVVRLAADAVAMLAGMRAGAALAAASAGAMPAEAAVVAAHAAMNAGMLAGMQVAAALAIALGRAGPLVRRARAPRAPLASGHAGPRAPRSPAPVARVPARLRVGGLRAPALRSRHRRV